MSQNTFHTHEDSITLGEPPWDVKAITKIYVKLTEGELALYLDSGCLGDGEKPLQLEADRDKATGYYFYLVQSPGASFPNPDDGHLPVKWETTNGECPATVRYGKMTGDRQAFSICDHHDHANRIEYGFQVVVNPPGGGSPISTSQFDEIDPTIVEKGEGPPPGAER